MKTSRLLALLSSLILVASASAQPATKPLPAAPRVGIYDSRLVAYAMFARPEAQADQKARIAQAKAAQARGDLATYHAIEQQLKAEQHALHLQVFSTAPIPPTNSWLNARIATVAPAAGVGRIVSKWDTATLRDVPAQAQIDVTELLVRDCHLTEAQRKTLRELAASTPIPLWRARLAATFSP